MDILDFSWIASPEAWIALLTLTILEIILGIDNIVFISILVDRLPEEQRPRARTIGLGLAMAMRILLLLCITWVMQLKDPLFALFGHDFSGKDLILIGGGLFLIWKSTHEIHEELDGDEEAEIRQKAKATATFGAILAQIAIIDIVFSLDSVITAVGMAESVMIMIIAVVIAVAFMMLFAGPVSNFISAHPTVKMLALSFLILIGFTLCAEGLHFHIPKGYIYFAMGFAIGVEALNLALRKKHSPQT